MKLILSILLLSIFSFSFSQSGFLSKNLHVWGVIIDGSSHFHVDKGGNFILTGAFDDSVFLAGDEEWIVAEDSVDFFMAKFNQFGQVIWKKLISGKGLELIFDFVVDQEGFIYLSGAFDKSILIDDTLIVSSSTIYYLEYFIAKFNPDGDLINIRMGSEDQEDLAFYSLDLDPQNNIIMHGLTMGSFAFQQPLPESSFEYKLFVAKLNNDFEPIWCMPAQRVRAVKSDNESNIYIAGINDEPLTIGDTILDIPEYTGK